ncbi:MAG: methyl-accepting chemotaxis protein [Leptospiraceae bacterium]|nr:methyl-accepting chemotaxis protein [Leptospiraceae bacterium]
MSSSKDLTNKSIKTLINSLFLIITSILIFLGIALFRVYFLAYIDAKTITENAIIAGQLNIGSIELSLERSVSQVSLNIPTIVPAKFEGLIRKQRQTGSPKIEESIRMLTENFSHPNKNQILEKLKKTTIDINDLRRIVDSNLSVPIEKRDERFIKNFQKIFPPLLENLRVVKMVLSPINISNDEQINIIEQIADLAWEIREFGGRERTYYAISLYNKTSIPDETLERMNVLHSRTEFARKKIDIFSKNEHVPQEIKNLIEKMENSYFSDYAAIKEKLNEQNKESIKSIEFDEYFEKSSYALGTAENLAKYSIDYIIKRSQTQKQNSLVTLISVGLFIFIALAISIYLVYYLNTKVVNKIVLVANALNSLTEGKKDIDYTNLEITNNEIGLMVKASQVFRENLIKLESMAIEQSSAVNETTQVVEVLDKSSKLSAEQASQVYIFSQDALKNAKEGEEMVDRLKVLQLELQDKVIEIHNLIKQLDLQTNEIGHITDLVTELAKQTNMLALNAAVEASRAGEFGRGFAVVSIEIRKLSDESKNSANKIQEVIDQIRRTVKKSVTLTAAGKEASVTGSEFADQTSDKFKEVANSIAKVTENIESIAINLRQQVRAHEEVKLAMNSLNTKTKRLTF